MNLTISQSASVITVFLQGLFSFFSPCVLPLLPVYIGYLSGGTLTTEPDGTRHYDRKKLIVNTIFYVFGISFAFFLLGLGMRVVGRFFAGNQLLFARIGGIIVVLFGLYQLGLFGPSEQLSRERRLPIRIDQMAMSPVTALLMGFVFSFAWTPCIGPVLSGVLLMAASAGSSAAGFFYIAVYTLGFAIPFLLTGLFAGTLLNWFQKHRNVVRYTEKAGGILLVFMGILMLSGQMNRISGYLSQASAPAETVAVQESTAEGKIVTAAQAESASAETTLIETTQAETAPVETTAMPAEAAAESQTENSEETASEREVFPAPDFTLKDQYGTQHTLSDYQGKIVFLNFWATWCPPCRAEMPEIEEIYQENLENPDSDLVILGVAFPGLSGEQNEAGIAEFLKENGYHYPTVMDPDGDLASEYYITAFPTTFMIDPDGNIFGYLTGSMSKDIMLDIIEQTRKGANS